jgi:hypothetical protein
LFRWGIKKMKIYLLMFDYGRGEMELISAHATKESAKWAQVELVDYNGGYNGSYSVIKEMILHP